MFWYGIIAIFSFVTNHNYFMFEESSSINPLAAFDNQVIGGLTHLGKNLSVRVFTNQESFSNYPSKYDVFTGPIALDSQQRFIAELKKSGVEAEENWFERKYKAASQEAILNWVIGEFQKPNYTVMILEDETGRPLSATNFTINDEERKRDFGVLEDGVPFVFFELSQTAPEHSGNGFLKIMRNYFLPDLLSQAGFSEEVHVTNAMKRMMATNPDTGEIHEDIPNLKIHGKILGFMGDVTILERWREGGKEDLFRESDAGVPMSDFIKEDGKFDNNKINEWISRSKAMRPDKYLEGCFMKVKVNNIEELRDRAFEELLESGNGKLTIKKRPAVEISPEETASLLRESQGKLLLGRDS